nr:unnamed protein product [Callosobruchus analis]
MRKNFFQPYAETIYLSLKSDHTKFEQHWVTVGGAPGINSSNNMATRNSSICPLFGSPSDLSLVVLPTNADLIRYFLQIRNCTKLLMANKDPSAAMVSKKVAQTLEMIWNKCSIPIISYNKIVEKIKKT